MSSSLSTKNYIPALLDILAKFSNNVGLSLQDITRYLNMQYPEITDNEINIMIEEGY
jgi:hypothetical protein